MNKGFGSLKNLINIIDEKRTISIIQVIDGEFKAFSRYNFLEKKWEDIHATRMSAACTITVQELKKSKLYKEKLADRKLYQFSSFSAKGIPDLWDTGVHSMTACYIIAKPPRKETVRMNRRKKNES